MNLSQMRDRVRKVLRDDPATLVVDTDINNWLNDGNLDVAVRLKVLRKEATGTPAWTNGQLALPSDFVEIGSGRLNVSWANGPDDVEWVDDEVFQSWKEDTGSPTPQRRLGRIYGANIEVYPTPAASTAYTLRYVATPAALSADGDTSELPVGLHMKVVEYARAMGKYMVGEDAEGDRYMSLYEQGLPNTYTGQEKKLPGPIDLRFDGGWFDTPEYLE